MKISMFHSIGFNEGQTRDETHIANALRKLGIEVFTNDESQIETADLVLLFKTNLFGLEHVKKWKTWIKCPPIIGWTSDNMDRFPWWYEIAKELTWWCGEELGRRERFKSEKIPFYYFPQHFANPETFKPLYLKDKPYDVTFLGTPYGSEMRKELLLAVQEKFNLHVWGNNPDGWKNWGIKNVHGPAFDKEANKVINQSKIVLSVSNCSCEGYWSVRSTCVTMAGGFLLTRFVPQIEKELSDGAIYFSEIEDCLYKIEYYLAHESERQDVMDQAVRIAHQRHTVEQRCKELLMLYEHRNRLMSMI